MPIRSPKLLSRAQGCLFGQLAGDALGCTCPEKVDTGGNMIR